MPKTSDVDESIRNAFKVLEIVVQKAIRNARMEGENDALARIREVMGEAPTPVKRGPGRPKGSKNAPKAAATKTGGDKRKNSWSGLSPEARLARVNAIRKGRGLPPKTA